MLIRDFLLTLFNKINETYLGDDITVNKYKIEHLEWCLDKTILFFGTIDIIIKKSQKMYDIVFTFFWNHFYNINKDITNTVDLKIRINNLFSLNVKKDERNENDFLSFYSVFLNSLG